VAQLAGVSFDYYARLEQGRQTTASENVLSSIAAALKLSEVERYYLFDLAGVKMASNSGKAQSARPGMMRLMDTLSDTPAVLLGRRTDILAANRAARAVFADFYSMPARERNVARWFFLDEAARRLHHDWEAVASDIIGMLRFDAGRYSSDPHMTTLVNDLTKGSQLFRVLWDQHRVVNQARSHKVFHHPLAGTLEFELEAVSAGADHGQTLQVFMPKPSSFTQRAVRLISEADTDKRT
jgi:transcriptional regulator with XRE-family HTH domain